jgi:two-component system chemotaxis sensor kinase CheA
MSVAAAQPLADVAAFQALFFEEADEHLLAIEERLLRIDQDSPSTEDLNAIFRAAHSIKGTSGMLGYPEIADLTHVLENLLDLLRKNERRLTRRDVDAMLSAGDLVKMQVAYRRGLLAEAPDMGGVRAELRELADEGAAGGGASRERRFAVRLGPLAAPVAEAELDLMVAGLAEMGSVEKRAMHNVEGGEIAFDVALSGGEADLRSVLELVVGPGQVQVRALEGAAPAASDAAPAAVARPEAAAEAELDLFVTPEAWRRRRKSDRPAPVPAAEEDEGRYGRRETDRAQPAAQADAGSIRVSVEKIDRLVNLVGELVITEAMLAQQHGDLESQAPERRLAGLRDLARHTRNLQEAVLSIRMVPISSVFTRFPRLVRELSQRLGKDVELKLSGEATELDRGLIERITDPLTHLVRNAIDHGLETPAQRLAAGKPRAGTISLAAIQRGGNVVIEVRDDGRGLDRARILARAAERGMPVSQDAPDHEVWPLVFEPGFSTAESVTDVSGRGVGMDVVRRNIQMLRGAVELESRAGAGTTVTVSVPLTLAIIEAMTVAVGAGIYALPLASVIEARRVAPGEIRGIAGQAQTLRVRDEYLPVRRLGAGDLAVIVEADGTRAALLVDALVGQQQVVVKNLEANFRRVAGISGATIMGDGKVALILDIAHIVNEAGPGSPARH